MIVYKTEEEIDLIRQSANILSQVHGLIAKNIAEGVSTLKLDAIAEEFIKDHGGSPSFKGYNGFKHSLCISLNSAVVHGIPDTYTLQSGDIVSIDCGVFYKGYHSDSAYTHAIGDVKPEIKALLLHTKDSLYKGIEHAVAGARIGDIGFAVQSHVEQFGYGVVRELVGHGLGKSLHEGPEIPNYGKRGQGMKLQEGLVLAIEPMVNLGSRHVVQENDGWTIRTRDKKPSAHFEHTVVVRKGQAEILTTFDFIEKAQN